MDSKTTHYKNGQMTYQIQEGIMTYFFKDGSVKAKGPYLENMDGEWFFYREGGLLWQVGHFKNGLKHGSWIRYDRSLNIEYNEQFFEGKQIKSKG